MDVTRILGNLDDFDDKGRAIDRVAIEWFEVRKLVLDKRTGSGREVTIRFPNDTSVLKEDAVLFEDATSVVVVEILPCDAIVLRPSSPYEMASLAYQAGNKQLPTFFEEDALLIPFDEPLFNSFQAAGVYVKKEKRKLLRSLRTAVGSPAQGSGQSLFSKILHIKKPFPEA